MAVPNPGGNVYKRDAPEDLHEAWNAVIRKVNDERENPPEDTNCEALDPIEEVEEDHIWTKQDVEELREAIDEMCEFAWTKDLEYWKDEIITEIEEALDREWGGWGDENECCKEECIPDCDNALDENKLTYWGLYSITACEPNPPPNNKLQQAQWAMEAGGRCDTAISAWISFWSMYCVLVDEVETLEEELENLQIQLTALEEIRDEECAKEPPNNCAEAQQAVDDKQQEVDDKQVELDDKIEERDAKLVEANEAKVTADGEAVSSMAFADASAPNGSPLLYSSMPGNEPWTNTACDELGPECMGKNPARCRVFWGAQKWTHIYYCVGWEWHGSGFIPDMTGSYTMSGLPYVMWIRWLGGLPGYACASFGPDPCKGWFCGTGCSSYYEYEARLAQNYPDTHPPDGEECCD